MKKERVLILGIVLTLFSGLFVSCLDDDDYNNNLFQFIYEPVIIKSESGKATMRTQYGDILAPHLNQAKTGEYYLTNFLMDKASEPHTAFALEYKRMGADTLYLAPGYLTTTTEVNAPMISNVKIYLEDPNVNLLKDTRPEYKFMCIDSTFFIEPLFSDSESNKSHHFDLSVLITAVDNGNDIPVLFLKAKATDEDIAKKAYALNLSTLLKRPRFVGKNEIQINLKFRSGVDETGGEIFTDYNHNPVTLKIR